MLRPQRFLSALLCFFVFAAVGLAQNKSKIKQQTPTVKGSTGLFNIPNADSLRQGEFSFGIHGSKFNREPGDIDITVFPLSFTLGLHDRIEFFASYELHKRVHATGIRSNRADVYYFLPQPTPFGSGSSAPQTPTQLAGPAPFQPGIRTSYYNDTPFLDLGFGSGPGELYTGFKFNLVSERYGGPLGLAIQPRFKVYIGTNDPTNLRQGLRGGNDYGFDLILSKDAGSATFTLTGGLTWAEDWSRAERQNSVDYGLGVDAPLGGKNLHFIGEFVGRTFYGDRETGFADVYFDPAGDIQIGGRFFSQRNALSLANPRSPADLYLGLRGYPARWVAVGAAYNLTVNRLDEATSGITPTDRHGWLAQVVFQRKVNRPPTITCQPASTSVQKTTVDESATVTLSADATDPDDDDLTVTWKAAGGRLTQQDSSATFDVAGLAWGNTYTVGAEVSDGDNVASCSIDVRVEKNRRPPTVRCEPPSTNITEGQSANLRAVASDPNGDDLSYNWTVDGQSVPNPGSTFEFGTAGRSVGAHTVRVTVTDVDSMSASADCNVTIDRRPNRGPSVTLTLDKSAVYAGETVTATATASDPDGDPLTYSWSVDNQSRPGAQSTLQINTGGMAGGSHSVSASVRDDRGAAASDTKTFSVREKEGCSFGSGTRVDNVCQSILDTIAVRLEQNPQLRVVITGHTDDRGSESANMRVGQRRADAVKDYLVTKKNIDAGRIETRSAGESEPLADNSTEEGRKQNRRVEIELFVP